LLHKHSRRDRGAASGPRGAAARILWTSGEQDRGQLAADPDAIALLRALIDNGWVRVAVAAGDRPIGVSVPDARDSAAMTQRRDPVRRRGGNAP
jgi:hypothetical protein